MSKLYLIDVFIFITQTCQELFYTPCALYVIVWDLGAKMKTTRRKNRSLLQKGRSFNNDFSDDDSYGEIDATHERFEALHNDIDENVQFWIEAIQRKAPGSSILIVGSHIDVLENYVEAQRRYEIMRKRLLYHQEREMQRVLKQFKHENSRNQSQMDVSHFCRNLCKQQPNLLFGISEKNNNHPLYVSNTKLTGFEHLRRTIVQIATDRSFNHKKLFSSHIGVKVPSAYRQIKEIARNFREQKMYLVERSYFDQQLMNMGITDTSLINNALHFLTNVGELTYYGDEKTNLKERFLGTSTSLLYNHESEKERGKTMSLPHLNDYIILNPRWLMYMLRYTVRPNLILQSCNSMKESTQHFDNVMNPTLSYEQMKQLLIKPTTVRKAVDLVNEKAISNTKKSPQDFLMQLLIRHNICIPINPDHAVSQKSLSIFLPSLLQSTEPNDDLFSHKSMDASELSLCHSWLFKEYVSIPVIEKITVAILNSIRIKSCDISKEDGKKMLGKVEMKEHFFWRNSFYLNLGNVKILVRMSKYNSRMCVASSCMSPVMSRLTISAKGSALGAGRFIWEEG